MHVCAHSYKPLILDPRACERSRKCSGAGPKLGWAKTGVWSRALAERKAGVTEGSENGERNFRRSRSAHICYATRCKYLPLPWRYSRMLVEDCDLLYSTCILSPLWGWPCRNFAIIFSARSLEFWSYYSGGKSLRAVDCWAVLYTSLFARKAAETSEKSTKHTTTTTKHKKHKKHCQSGRTSEQCYHITTVRTQKNTC